LVIPLWKMSSAILRPRGNPANVLGEVGLAVALHGEGVVDPVHAQVDPAPAVLLDHVPEAVVEATDVAGPDGSLVVGVDPVELVGHEGQALGQVVRLALQGSGRGGFSHPAWLRNPPM